MPLTLTLTKNVLPADKLQSAVKQLTQSFLKHHGLAGNTVMTPNVTAQVQILDPSHSFSGGEPLRGAWVEWKTPSFAFSTREVQVACGKEATEILHELSGGEQPKDNIYFNVVHTVDGTWNLNGEPLTNEELGKAIALGAPAPSAR